MVQWWPTGLECQRCAIDSHSRHNISHFHNTHDTERHDHNPVQATSSMVGEPALCMHMGIACMVVSVSLKRIKIPEG